MATGFADMCPEIRVENSSTTVCAKPLYIRQLGSGHNTRSSLTGVLIFPCGAVCVEISNADMGSRFEPSEGRSFRA